MCLIAAVRRRLSCFMVNLFCVSLLSGLLRIGLWRVLRLSLISLRGVRFWAVDAVSFGVICIAASSLGGTDLVAASVTVCVEGPEMYVSSACHG